MPRLPATPPEGFSSWQSPLTIRETIIVVVAVCGFAYQWANVSGQLSQLSHDMAGQSAQIQSVHADVAVLATELRSHVESPGHAVSNERQTVLTTRLDELDHRLGLIESELMPTPTSRRR